MDKAMELLQELATKLGTTVETLWPHYVEYIWAYAVGEAAIFLAALVALVVALRIHGNRRALIRAIDDEKARRCMWEEHAGWAWLLGLTTTAYFIVLFIMGPRVIARLVAPGGAALRALLKIIGGAQ